MCKKADCVAFVCIHTHLHDELPQQPMTCYQSLISAHLSRYFSQESHADEPPFVTSLVNATLHVSTCCKDLCLTMWFHYYSRFDSYHTTHAARCFWRHGSTIRQRLAKPVVGLRQIYDYNWSSFVASQELNNTSNLILNQYLVSTLL